MKPSQSQQETYYRVSRAALLGFSLLAIGGLGVPWINEYYELQRDAVELNALESKLTSVRQRQDALNKIEQTIASETGQFFNRNVTKEKIESAREQLIEIVRVSKARLRRLEITPSDPRIWASENDDARNDAMPIYGEPSGFVIQSHTIELEADGSLDAIGGIIQSISKQGWLMSTKNVTVGPTNTSASPIKLEMRLVAYGLSVAEEPTDAEEERDLEDIAAVSTQNSIR
ncbi:hypothetical protein K227x_55400 [Rubripirellula lacrimiformis]|uniref:Pilus assembly protein, PilO n=1 Tax=Rubripirellula lacrimiformis TaxID=1930273 RepID=A0A517NJ06_9BACT|nr:hypothetical protein [Rubripirellula lacrimiformis]QDT07115.1 hypothetical protein K227x_55400 [Rubripirellula lacrimiformis]